MGQNRFAKRTDSNQKEIVKSLRDIPGVSVITDCNDILVGRNGATYWFEIKSESAISKRTGSVQPSKVRKSQKLLISEFTGHYKIVSSLEEILAEIWIR
jgi:hypothetical protein